MAILFEFLLFLDGIVYNIIDWIYDIFNYLAGLNLFKESVYMDIVQRIYVILGMVMLFILAYTLLKAVVNPENFAKGEQSFPKLIQNVLVSLVIIVMLPTVFSVAYNVQNSILTYNTIPKLILGDDNANDYTKPDAPNTFKNKQGKKMALYIFSSVFHENASWCASGTISSKSFEVVGESDCAKEINGNGGWFVSNGDPLNTATANLKDGKADFTIYKTYSEAIRDGKIEYLPIVSTIIGIFTAYVLVNYCFDMALRVIKLMFFQIIAPVPVICRILPGGKMKDVFSDWLKKTISTFVEVFIRIAIIYLGVFLINEIVKEFPNLPNGGLSFTQLLVCKVLLIMGVVIFIRQAPKLISEMFHLDSGSMKLGIMDKLAMGGALTAGAAVGGALTTLGRNSVASYRQSRQEGHGGLRSAWHGLRSGVAGGISAGARAGYAARNAKNFGDTRTAASSGARAATDRRVQRASYRAANGNNAWGVLTGHVRDARTRAGEFLGLDSLDDLKKEQAAANEMAGIYSNLKGAVADDVQVRSAKTRLEERLKAGVSDTVLDEQRYKAAIVGKFKELKAAGHTDAEANALAKAQISKESFMRKMSAQEFQKAQKAYNDEIKALQYQVDFAEYSAINKDIDGKYKDQANTYNRLLQENASYGWAQGLSQMGQESIPASLQAAMNSGDSAQIIAEFEKFKDGAPGYAGFFSDSKNLKRAAGEAAAKIANKRQENAQRNGGSSNS